MKKSLIQKLLMMLLVCSMLFGSASVETTYAKVAPGEKSMYDVLTPKLTKAAFDYMNDVYVKRYPKLGLRLKYGTKKDQDVIRTLALKVTKGCKTNQEKTDKIAHWIRENILYKGGTSAYAIDTFYERKGNCVSDSELMKDMLRSLGIPAVVADGFYADMKEVPAYGEINGHSWCYAYIDGTWKLYDIVYKKYGWSNQNEIAKYYYHEWIEGTFLTFEGMDWEKTTNGNIETVYENGKFFGKKNGKIATDEIVGYRLNDVLFCGVTKQDNATHTLITNPERTEQMEMGQLYTDGWLRAKTGGLVYVYENGMMADNVFMEYEGKPYYMYFGWALKMEIPEKYCRMRYGLLCISKGYQGKSFQISDFEQYEKNGDYTITYQSDKPKVIEIRQDGTINCKSEGTAKITVKVYKKGENKVVGECNTMLGVWKETTPDYMPTRYNPYEKKRVKITSAKSRKKKKISVSWKKMQYAAGFEVMYASNKKFTKNKKCKETKKTSITLKKLKSKKVYYVKVRSYMEKYGMKFYSKWSKAKRVKVK